jgi:hypothetical protein
LPRAEAVALRAGCFRLFRADGRAYLAVHREAVVLTICPVTEESGYSGQTDDISDKAATYRKTRKDVEQDTSMMRNCCQDSNLIWDI